MMLDALAKNWWLLVLRGMVAILFGLLALAWPGLTLDVLALLYGVFVLADGVFALVAAIRGGAAAPRWWLAITGLAGVAAGVLTFFWPAITALVLLLFIAAWAIVTGIMQIVGAVQLRKEISGEWRLVVGGILSVVFGALVFAWPVAGALAVTFVIGVYAIAYGILLVSFSLRLWRHARASLRPSPRHEHRTA